MPENEYADVTPVGSQVKQEVLVKSVVPAVRLVASVITPDQLVAKVAPMSEPLQRTPWFTPSFYPSREGWYEARFFTMPSANVKTPDEFDRVRFDGVDWELEDTQVLVAWRGLVEDPAGDL